MNGPKHRSTMYAVVRLGESEHHDSRAKPTLIGAFISGARADEVAASSAQTMKDLGIDGFKFEVQAVTFYEE